jgi:hypothetical protein
MPSIERVKVWAGRLLRVGLGLGTVPDWYAAIRTTLAFSLAFYVLLREQCDRATTELSVGDDGRDGRVEEVFWGTRARGGR